MGHYDNCRPGYCGKCGAAPGNMRSDGTCSFCMPSVFERIQPALEAQRQARTTHWRCCNIQCGASYNEAKERCDSCGNMVYAVGGIA